MSFNQNSFFSKIIISLFLTFFFHALNGQESGQQIDYNSFLLSGSLNGAHLLLNESGSTDYARLRFTNSSFNSATNNRYWDIAAKIGTSNSLDEMNFYSRQFGNVLSLSGDGKVGILTTAPGAALEVNGFTKLGNNAPQIKMKKMEVTTDSDASDDCFSTQIPDTNKVLSVNIHLYDNISSLVIPRNYGGAYDFNYFMRTTSGSFEVCLDKNGSSSRGNDFVILLTYE